MADIRRFSLMDVPSMARRPWEDVGPELERFLRKLYDSETNGIPAGFNVVVPTAITPGVDGDPGTERSGWAAADHEHPVTTAPATDLANANAEGTASALARSDHKHKRDVRVKLNGADVGTRNALNFVGSWGIVDDGGNDEIDITSEGVAEDALLLALALSGEAD
jgi:hypothetical protein